GLAVATSIDGRSWKRGTDTLLTPEQFGCRLIGLPYVIERPGGWLMVFEGIRSGRFSIYGATSQDGRRWTPARDGSALYDPPADSWDELGQANPSIYFDRDGRAAIVYNGTSDPDGWEIGLLVSRDGTFDSGWDSAGPPIVCRGDAGAWDAGRV